MAITLRDSSTYTTATPANSHNIPYPTNVQDGDVLVLVLGNDILNNPPNTPSGWSVAAGLSPSGVNRNSWIFYKVADGTEGGTSLTVTWPSASTNPSGGMLCYQGVDSAQILDVTPPASEDQAASASHAAPSITPQTNNTKIIHVYTSGGNSAGGWTPDAATTERFDMVTVGSGRRTMAADRDGPAASVASGTATATGAGSLAAIVSTIALREYVPTYDETMRPTGVSSLSNLTGAYTDIDQDPDGAITDPGLVGADPSAQTGLTTGNTWPNARAAASGATAFPWNTPANITDSSETTLASIVSATTAYTDWFDVDSGLFITQIPDDATITAVQYQVKHRAGTTGRVSIFCQMAEANGGTLIGTETTIVSGLGTTAGGITNNINATGTMPTPSQLKGAGFGWRFRIARSAASTYELYYVRIVVTYSTPARTTNTQADVALADPVGTLKTGTASGEIRARIRKKGSGANPTAQIELHDSASSFNYVVIGPSVTITESDADGQLLSGTFNQSIVTNKTDLLARVLGTGAAGGLAELVAIEWNVQIEVVQPITLVGAVGIRGEA